MKNIRVLFLSIALGGVALFLWSSFGGGTRSFAAADTPPATDLTDVKRGSARPARLWAVYWRDDKGVRYRTVYAVTTPDEAIKAHRAAFGGVLVTCLEQPYYAQCTEK